MNPFFCTCFIIGITHIHILNPWSFRCPAPRTQVGKISWYALACFTFGAMSIHMAYDVLHVKVADCWPPMTVFLSNDQVSILIMVFILIIMDPFWMHSGYIQTCSRINRKSTKLVKKCPNLVPKPTTGYIENPSKIHQIITNISTQILLSYLIFVTFSFHLDDLLEPSWAPRWSENRPNWAKLAPTCAKLRQVSYHYKV